jgi:hypothetical protein
MQTLEHRLLKDYQEEGQFFGDRVKEILQVVKEWLSENRECPQEPLSEKGVMLYYRTYDNLLNHQLSSGNKSELKQ